MMAASGVVPRRTPRPALPFAAMSSRRRLVIPAVLLGVLLVIVAIIYFVEPAHSLPSFFPGHASASDAEASHHHTKHGIAALVVAFACFAFAWFASGPNPDSAAPST
jgi:NADH:ubiquinone oxidoreductase subunit 5 (subunit L)/multisubunit Na+/H+ antiporter MnhA subunit